ncbi:MAG: beta-lactamase family protein [Planctomycetia bacterium]|nr:beta-lactamase family protein [Planctomycetia bacterium]
MRTPPRAFLAALALAIAPAGASAGDPRSLDDVLEPIRAKHKLPSLAAVVVTADGLQAQGAVGSRRAGREEPVTTADLWHLGSCTKAMTATLVARLVEQGKLRWTTTLGEVFPKLEDRMDEGWRAVTLEQLLANRGGAPAALDRDGLWGELRAHKGTQTEARRLLLEGVVAHAPEYDPGTKYVYSNAGFAIAGHVAEVVTGTAWEDLMKREVFAPLGIESAGFGAPGRAAEKADQPRGHTSKGDPVEPGPGSDNPVAIGPAGIVHMSLPEWGKFVAAHLEGGADGGGERRGRKAGAEGPFLGEESWKKLHTPPGDNYAMGWATGTRPWAKGGKDGDTGRVLTHNGSNTMWFCVTWLAPEKGFAVLVATNAGGDAGGKGTDEAAGAAIKSWSEK